MSEKESEINTGKIGPEAWAEGEKENTTTFLKITMQDYQGIESPSEKDYKIKSQSVHYNKVPHIITRQNSLSLSNRVSCEYFKKHEDLKAQKKFVKIA